MFKRWIASLTLLTFIAGTMPAMADDRDNRRSSNVYGTNALPEGTTFLVKLEDKLDTEKVKRGKKFKAKLLEDLEAPDGTIIPRGKKLKGHVSEVERGYSAQLLLSFDEIETKNGWVPLTVTVIGVPGEHSVKDTTGKEGEIERRGASKTTIRNTAIGAGVGAVVGGVSGGTKGAIIGAAIGGGAGLGASLLTGRDLTLEDGQQLELRLDRPLRVPRR
jgi:hypothetical protein